MRFKLRVTSYKHKMAKKLLFGLGAFLFAVAGVAGMSAFEAHVINVTAHIENALYVHPDALDFGTVFPQEDLDKQFTVELSSSFQSESRVKDVNYVIVQKPKPVWPEPQACDEEFSNIEEARAYCIANPSDLDCCYRDLCKFLSKEDADPADNNDTSEPSYFVPGTTPTCNMSQPQATGHLEKPGDLLDSWTVDLKVPPVAGTVGQDWPAGCPTVQDNAQNYGCDLWIEVTGISLPPP